MLNKKLEKDFPNLARVGYEVTSDPSEDYNCVAWAAGIDDEWWALGRKWPGIYGTDIDALKSVFQFREYKDCANSDQEAGYEKIALYEDDRGYWRHVARQLPDGWWTSKLGPDEDIRHKTPYAILNGTYCRVCFMKRELEAARYNEVAAVP